MAEPTPPDNPAPSRVADAPECLSTGRLLQLFESHHAAWSRSAQFRRALAEVRHEIGSGRVSQAAVTLHDEQGWKTTLLGLAAGAEIPLHDHPQTRGLLFVETGSVAIRRYTFVLRPPRSRAVLLADHGSKRLEAGGYDWIGKRYHNLHGIRAGAAGALIFSVHQSTSTPEAARVYACIETPPGPDPAIRVAITKPGGRPAGAAPFD